MVLSLQRKEEREREREIMDTEELQFLGVFGIFKESFKIIFTRKKIFTQITLSLILPLSFVFLAHFQISQIIFFSILNTENSLHRIPHHTPSYAIISDLLFSQWTFFCLFKFAYFTFLLTLSLFSTSAVVFTVASIYASSKTLTFSKLLISLVPKVWNRLMITFNWNFALVLVYNVVSLSFFVFWIAFIGPDFSLGFLIGGFLLILYLMGFLYITIIWHLACVISVLEDSYGKEAMIKSMRLIKGKTRIAIVMSFLVFLCFLGIQLGFETFVVIGLGGNGEVRIGVAILCLIFLLKVILFGLVQQTVLYFVCKSYHHENVDMASLADHLEVYHGEYVALKDRDVQLPETQV